MTVLELRDRPDDADYAEFMVVRDRASIPGHAWEDVLGQACFALRVERPELSDVVLRVGDTGPVRWLETTSGPQVYRREGAADAITEAHYAIMPLPRHGRFRAVRGRQTEAIHAARTMLADTEFPYVFEQLDNTRFLALRVDAEPLLERLPSALYAKPVDLSRGAGALLVDFVHDAWPRFAELTDDECPHLVGVVLDLLALALSASGTVDAPLSEPAAREAHLRRALRFLAANLHDPDLSPQRCAQAIGVSRRYLDRLFEARQDTVARYIREERLLRSREALRSPLMPQQPIEQVAYSLGFASASHFSRLYRRRFGRTPRQERADAAAARRR